MENLQQFIFNERAVRVLINENNEPWFVAKDIADILGYSETNRLTARLDEDEIMSTKLVGMNMKSTIINESGLYNAVLGSQRLEAKAFKKWVTSEVLTSIRKHGAFLTKEKTEELLSDPDLIIGIATKLKEERQEKERLQQITDLQQKELKAAAPKLEYFNKVITSTSTYLTDQIAKELGMTAIKLNKKLYSMEVQFKRGEQWVLTAKYADKKYTETRTHPFTKSDGTQGTSLQTVWTEKGRSFIHWLMNKDLSFAKGNQSAANS